MGGGAGKEKQAIFNTPGDNRPESTLICRGGGMGVAMLLWRFCVGITIIPEPVRGGKIGLVPISYVEGKLWVGVVAGVFEVWQLQPFDELNLRLKVQLKIINQEFLMSPFLE